MMSQVRVHGPVRHPGVVPVSASVPLGGRGAPHHASHHPPGPAGHRGGLHRGRQHPREVVPRQVRHPVELPPHHARPRGRRRLSHAQGGGDGPRLDVSG